MIICRVRYFKMNNELNLLVILHQKDNVLKILCGFMNYKKANNNLLFLCQQLIIIKRKVYLYVRVSGISKLTL